MIRSITHYTGQVQGVGFRMTVDRLAQGYRVTGYVKNLADGRVLLVAEGDAAEVRGLLQAVAQRMDAYISHAETDQSPATGEFREFTVRY
jgi:acylphosphatase